jgi:hypothetical protein
VSAAAGAGPLSERDLALIWEGQRFPPSALATAAGQPLRVLYRGLRGRGPGPDYRDAVIGAPWGTLRGDVELHVRASDFRRHGHHRDPAYDRLALHLVYWPDATGDTELASGRRVTVAALAPWVERRSGEVRRWLARPALWREPCRDAVGRMGAPAVAAVLDRLGDIRFRRRAGDLRRAAASGEGEEALYAALLEALGYGGNGAAFRLLAGRLPWRALRARLRELPPDGRAGAALAMLTEAAVRPPALALRTAGLRPGNAPRRRLVAAAELAARYAEGGLAAGLRGLLPADAGAAVRALRLGALIGRGRAVELLSNAVLPFFASEGEGEQALALYRALPRPASYGAVHHLDEALSGALPLDARRQQGMLFLLRGYCQRGRCGSCPLS